jgi:alpha/beta superfamily hydrolase
MHNSVVTAIFNNLINNDISCLRFNFRAVGRSTGFHSNGEGELSDVKACIHFLIHQKNFEKLIICGYSYGAAIGCSNVNYKNQIIGFIAISFPWDMVNEKYKKFSQSKKPKLFIQGDRDNIAAYNSFSDHYNYYSDPKAYKIIKGADHFYWGYENQVFSAILEFYNSITKKLNKF